MGNEVVLSTNNINKYCPHLPAKIKAWWVEPFTITHKFLPVAYKMDLLLGWHFQPVFHIEKLKKIIYSQEFFWKVQPTPPMIVGDHLEYKLRTSSGMKVMAHTNIIWYSGKGIHLLKQLGNRSKTSLTL